MEEKVIKIESKGKVKSKETKSIREEVELIDYKLRDYQRMQYQFIEDRIDIANVIGIEANTGSGKSITMLKFVKDWLNNPDHALSNVVISTGFNNLVFLMEKRCREFGLTPRILIGTKAINCPAYMSDEDVANLVVFSENDKCRCGNEHKKLDMTTDDPSKKECPYKRELYKQYINEIMNNVGQVIITNHSSLLVHQDKFKNCSLLIIDEAHTFADFYESYLRLELDKGDLEQLDKAIDSLKPPMNMIVKMNMKNGVDLPEKQIDAICNNIKNELLCNKVREFFETKPDISNYIEMNNYGPGNCVIKTCGKYVDERDSFGRCKECHDKWYKEHNSSPEMKIVQAKNGKKVTSERQKPGICLRCLRYKIKRNSAGVCSECMRNETLDNKKPGNCKCCGEYNEIRDTMGRCKRCRDLSLQDWRTSEKFLKMLQENGYITVERNKNLDQICEDCGKVFHSPFIMKIGPCCNPNLHKSNFEIRNGIMFYKDKELNIFIKDILDGKENIDDYPGFSIRYGKVCYKGIDILTNEFLSIQGNFTMIDGIKYYKQIPVEVISQKILDGIYNINDFPGFNIRFGRVCYYSRDIINDDIYIFNNTNFYTLNDLLYIYDNEINDYILYSKFKEKYSKNNNYDSVEPFIDEIQDKYSNAFIQPTYRSQNSTTWSGAKDAFELDLNQMEIGYFAYIKFVYNIDPITGEIDYNSIKPAIAGKSGTLLVNSSGTDVNFSEDEKDGPTRKMIQNGLISWCKSFILVIPTENECAYEVERNLQKEYKLLGS